MTRVPLTGATVDWVRWNTSWGQPGDSADPVDAETRALVLAGQRVRFGEHGYGVRVELTVAQVNSLWSILVSIAEAGESMTADERGDDAYNYRAIRRDVNRMGLL